MQQNFRNLLLHRRCNKEVTRHETSGYHCHRVRALKERNNTSAAPSAREILSELFQTFHVWLLSCCRFAAQPSLFAKSLRLFCLSAMFVLFVFSQTVSAQDNKKPDVSPTPLGPPRKLDTTTQPATTQPSVVKPQTNTLTPSKTALEFYKLMREKKFVDAFALTIYKSALEGLTAEELEDLRPDFESLASNIPENIEAVKEEVSGDRAIVFVRIKDIDDDTPKLNPVQLRRSETGWIILPDDINAEAAVKRDGKNYFFNLRIDTHHEEVEAVLREIIKAEFAYATQNGGRYADLTQLVRSGLLNDDLLSTQSTGYKFRITVSKDGRSYSGGAEPERYGRTGRFSYSLKVNSFDKKDTGGKPYNQ